jgi:hypothetical protein
MLSSLLRKSSIRDMRVSPVRLMSVISLSNQEAVEKFLIINSKSVLYFTAQVCRNRNEESQIKSAFNLSLVT